LGKWGNKGRGEGEFDCPGGIAITSSGTVFVSDDKNYRVQYFDSTGRFLGLLRDENLVPFRFMGPRAVCVGAKGLVYVVDTGRAQIIYFRPVPTGDN
jgi:hypothetical protein